MSDIAKIVIGANARVQSTLSIDGAPYLLPASATIRAIVCNVQANKSFGTAVTVGSYDIGSSALNIDFTNVQTALMEFGTQDLQIKVSVSGNPDVDFFGRVAVTRGFI